MTVEEKAYPLIPNPLAIISEMPTHTIIIIFTFNTNGMKLISKQKIIAQTSPSIRFRFLNPNRRFV